MLAFAGKADDDRLGAVDAVIEGASGAAEAVTGTTGFADGAYEPGAAVPVVTPLTEVVSLLIERSAGTAFSATVSGNRLAETVPIVCANEQGDIPSVSIPATAIAAALPPKVLLHIILPTFGSVV